MSSIATKTDPLAREWAITDELVRLREWATDRVHALPTSAADLVIGSGPSANLRLDDSLVSRQHARLTRSGSAWLLRDLGSKNGVRLNGERRDEVTLEPGDELAVGGVTLIAESGRSIALRAYLARILGWTPSCAESIDHALRALRLAAARRIPLTLAGDADVVAHALHQIALGTDRPFITCDPRRQPTAANAATAMQGLTAATGGSLCVFRDRLPKDFERAIQALQSPAARVQLVICNATDASIVVPPLASRTADLPRLVHEYALDAIESLAARRDAFTVADRAWVTKHAADSLGEIEKTTQRIVALRACGNVNRAASALGLAHVSLSRWIERRKLGPHLGLE